MRASNPNRVKFVRSTVDETLFGERAKSREQVHVLDFEPPWAENGKTKASPSRPLLFYCPTSSSRPSSSRSQVSSPLRTYKPTKFSPSYADDTLFGKRRTKRSDSPPPSEFEPPWVKESDKKPVKPLLFDFNSRLVFDNSCDENDAEVSSRCRTPQSSRTASRASARTQSVGNTSKPPWR